MSTCRKCGLSIVWGKSKNGKPMPVNPDGSEHWDACSTQKTLTLTLGAKVYKPIYSKWITGMKFFDTRCGCIPWLGCEKCQPKLIA